MSELLPCPFCGGNVECSNCGCGTKFKSNKEEASHIWNTRPSPWVKVSERLPESSLLILFGLSDPLHVASDWRKLICKGYYNAETKEFFDSSDEPWPLQFVDCWMEVPPLPEEE